MLPSQSAVLLFFVSLCHAGHALAAACVTQCEVPAAMTHATLNATALRVPAAVPTVALAKRSRRSCDGARTRTAPAHGSAGQGLPRTQFVPVSAQIPPKSIAHVHYVGQPAPVACNVSTHRHPWLATFLTMTFLIAIIAAIITCSD